MTRPPWRLTGLDGYSTMSGPTFGGGQFTGGGPYSPSRIAVRLLTPYGKPCTVALDICDERHGSSVTLNPEQAREAAAALLAGADGAEAEMQRWRQVVEQQRADLARAAHKDALGRADLDG